MQQVVSAPQLRAGGFAPDPRISPAMGPMPNSSFPQNIASQMDYLRKNQQAKAERYEEVQPYKREKDSQELRVLQQKYEAHLNHPQDIIVTIDRLFRYLDAKAKKAELQQQNGTKKATQAVSTAHESNFTFASKTNGGQKNNNDSSTADPSTASRKRPLSSDDYWSDESRADGNFQSFGGPKVPRMDSNTTNDVKRSYNDTGEPQMSNGSTVSVEIRQEITYPGMPTGGVHRLNTSVTVRHGGNAADATVHTNTTNFAASDNRSAPESSGDSQPTNSASTTMPQSSDDLFGDFNLSNDDFKELFTGFPPDFQFSAEDLEQLDCHMMASTSSSLRLDSNDFSLSSRNSQHFLMDSNGSQMKTSSSQSNQFSSNQSGQMQDNSMNQSAANPNGFSNQSNNDSSASVALRSLADQQSRSCPNQSNDQPDSNQYNYGAKCEGSPYDQMGQVRMGPPPSYQEVVPPSRQVSGSHGFNESEGNAIGNSPKMSPLMYSNGDGQVPFGQKGLTNANYRAVTPPANMSSNMRGTNNMEACDSLSALQMSLNKRSTLLGLNGANATRPSGGPFQQTMASNPQPVPGELRMGQMQMGNVRPQQQQQQQQQVGQFNQRNLATPLNISAPSQIFPQNNEFAGGGQQQMVMSSKQQQMLLQCGTFPAGMQRPDQRFMGDGGQMYLQAEHQQQNLIIQQGGKMAGSAGQPHLFPQEIPNNMAGYSAQRQQQFTGFPEGMNRGNVMRGGPGMMPQVVVSDPFSSMPSNPQQQRFAAAQHPQFVQTGPSMFAKGGATIGEEMKMFTAAPTKKGRLVNNATGRVVPPNVSVVAPTMDNFRFGPQEAGRPMFFEVDGQMVRQGGGMQDPMASYASYDGRPVPMAQQQQHQMMQQSQRHMEFVQNGQSGQRGINFMQMEQSQQAAMRFSAADRQIAMQQQQQFSHMSGGPGGISQAQMEMQMRSSASMQMASGPNPNMRGNPFPQGPGGNGRGKPPGPLSMNDPNMYSYM